MTADRIPLNTLAIGFGLAGLSEMWSTASRTLGIPEAIGSIFWAVSAVAWLWLIVAHLIRGARVRSSLAAQLRHPAQGPIAALVPITGMLISTEIVNWWEPAGVVLLVASIVASALFAGWLIGTWMEGRLALEAIHGGYLLPTVAAGLVGAAAAAHAGFMLLAWALFGVGIFFWAVMTVLILTRLAFRPTLPDPLAPTMAILVAPPAVAGIAWFALTGDVASPVAAALAGLTVMFLVVQLALMPRYYRLTFTLGFWSFTFPAAAVATDTLLWMTITRPAGWQWMSIIILAGVTVLILSIAARSLATVIPWEQRIRAGHVLSQADDVDANPSQTKVSW